MRALVLLIGMIIASVSVAPAVQATPRAAAYELHAGDRIYSGGSRCAVSAFARGGGTTLYFITAGHCVQGADAWYADAAQTIRVGTTSGSFPGNDYAVGALDPGIAPSQDFTSAGNPVVGQTVTVRGSTTGTHSGIVQALNVTVDYGPDGFVTGLIQASVCAGDVSAGAPLTGGSTVYGLLVSGADCSTGGASYFQPIVEVLAAYGLGIL
jgi:streptogrisin B